ncbi:MAG TPA: BON domain-containing protein [Planctomycetaceae bacterium]|nr:BON domain-containing protein [Planctomycetaceae bacterium]
MTDGQRSETIYAGLNPVGTWSGSPKWRPLVVPIAITPPENPMRFRMSICAGLVALSGWAMSSDAWAQTRGTTGQNGQGGQGSTASSGSSMFGGSTGTSGLGTAGVGTGQGGAGQGGLGQQGTGQNRNNAMGAQQGQNNGFLGVNNNPNNFLGRNAQGQTNLNGQTGNTGRNNRAGQRGGNRQLDSNLQNMLNGGQQGGGGQTQQQPAVRPRQKVAFEYPQPKLEAVIATTQTRLTKLAVRYPHLSDVQLSQESDGTVVLRGSAPSENDARVAENMLRFEPGVRKIRNELTFPPPRPDSE